VVANRIDFHNGPQTAGAQRRLEQPEGAAEWNQRHERKRACRPLLSRRRCRQRRRRPPLAAAGPPLSRPQFKLFDVAGDALTPAASGLADRVGSAAGVLSVAVGRGPKAALDAPIPSHEAALALILGTLKERLPDLGVAAVGHRIVHGLALDRPSLLTADVLATIQRASTLAPLHNPSCLAGVAAATRAFGPAVPQVGVFDTAFHQTLPPAAHTYAIPEDLAAAHHLRRYGFHGTSHASMAAEAARLLGRRPEQVSGITCHLGNGCSITAIRGGQSVDTSMGLTPLEGLVMGTRCGDIDPALALHLQTAHGMSAAAVDELLNKRSGLRGLCGDSDVRSILQRRAAGDARAAAALDVFVYRIRKYIGAYAIGALGGAALDFIALSGGIGENSPPVRALILAGLRTLGVEMCDARNGALAPGTGGDIATAGSPARVFVVPADEELAIATATLGVLAWQQGQGASAAA